MNKKLLFTASSVLMLSFCIPFAAQSTQSSTVSADSMVFVGKDITKERNYQITREAYSQDGKILWKQTTNAPLGSLIEIQVVPRKVAEENHEQYVEAKGDKNELNQERANLVKMIRSRISNSNVNSDSSAISAMVTAYPNASYLTSGSFSTGHHNTNASYTIYWGTTTTVGWDYLITDYKYSLDSTPQNGPVRFEDVQLSGAGRDFDDNSTCPTSPVSPNTMDYTLDWFGHHGDTFYTDLSDGTCGFFDTVYEGYVTM